MNVDQHRQWSIQIMPVRSAGPRGQVEVTRQLQAISCRHHHSLTSSQGKRLNLLLVREKKTCVTRRSIVDVIPKRASVQKNYQPRPIIKTTACNSDIAGVNCVEISEIRFD